MNVFNIIGPIMIGPSSSHTAGAVRIGRITMEILGASPVDVVIKLHGSFARTYKGHGTDRAIIAGLMGMSPDDELIRNSMQLAHQTGMKYQFETAVIEDAHPNTALICAADHKGKKVIVQGSSVGGGNIIINRINDMVVEFTGEYYTLLVSHVDTPGVVAVVTNLLAFNNLNIASMKVYRSFRGGEAMMVIETDQEVKKELELMIEGLHNIKNATLVKPV